MLRLTLALVSLRSGLGANIQDLPSVETVQARVEQFLILSAALVGGATQRLTTAH